MERLLLIVEDDCLRVKRIELPQLLRGQGAAVAPHSRSDEHAVWLGLTPSAPTRETTAQIGDKAGIFHVIVT